MKQAEGKLSGWACNVWLINQHIWVCSDSTGVAVLDPGDLTLKQTITSIGSMWVVYDVAEFKGDVIVAEATGLYQADINGEKKYCLKYFEI